MSCRGDFGRMILASQDRNRRGKMRRVRAIVAAADPGRDANSRTEADSGLRRGINDRRSAFW